MPAEDDSKQETQTIHLFQMQGADYTNSKYFALKPEPKTSMTCSRNGLTWNSISSKETAAI